MPTHSHSQLRHEAALASPASSSAPTSTPSSAGSPASAQAKPHAGAHGTALLFEIGVEELPASFVDAALAALPELVKSRLAVARLAHGAVRALGTPRRLAVLVDGVAATQADLDEQVVGPPETAAYKDGAPTKAAEAFANKLGVAVASLEVVQREAEGQKKAGRYVVGRRKETGAPAEAILGKLLADVAGAIPFKKSMRWGSGAASFGRPVQWIVALFGSHTIDLAFAGVRSGRTSRGHRFLAPERFDIADAREYVDALRERHVIVDRAEREAMMMQKVAAAAEAVGGTHDTAPILVVENTSLVEEPFVVTGTFESRFLVLPASLIRAVARGHQRYFSVNAKGKGREDELLPHYVTVVNTALDVPTIARGNDNVMRARLSDALFFFEEDKKAKLEDRVGKLEGIVFHQKLGTVREKVVRVERLAKLIATKLGLDAAGVADVARAAHLAKADLVSLMVGEFPELQGEMGRAYAKNAGEKDAVADAIRDHYKPLFATDDVAPTDVSAAVALADRLDTLAGCFGVGLEPSGTADPYALRRACIAVLRTLQDRGATDARYAELDLLELLHEARQGFTTPLEKDSHAALTSLATFATERLRGLIAGATSNAVADAVVIEAAGGPTSPDARVRHPVHVRVRASALQAVIAEGVPWLAQAKTVAKRLSGISKQSAPVLHPAPYFDKPDDAAIVKVVLDADVLTRELKDEPAVRKALAAAGELAQRVDAIFENTLVNDPKDAKTPARLELLSYGAACMLRLADFSRLA
jgi:glycyl-tRNA synthetase beta chain